MHQHHTDFRLQVSLLQRLPSRMMKTIQFQIFHHQQLFLKGSNPQHRPPCSHRFILRSKGFHHPRTFHLIQFHHDQTGHNCRGHQPHLRRAQLPPNVIRSQTLFTLATRGPHQASPTPSITSRNFHPGYFWTFARAATALFQQQF